MAPIPEKKEDLVAAGWLYDNDATCRGCKEPIEWWISPAGKKMPMTVQTKKDGEGFFAKSLGLIRVPHWGVCPNAEDFRRPK